VVPVFFIYAEKLTSVVWLTVLAGDVAFAGVNEKIGLMSIFA
jgi:hypothetical protein